MCVTGEGGGDTGDNYWILTLSLQGRSESVLSWFFRIRDLAI